MQRVESFYVSARSTIRDGLRAINENGKGHLICVDDADRFLRMVSDGDLRRLLLAGFGLDDTLDNLPDIVPVIASMETSFADLMGLFTDHGVAVIPRLDDDRKVRLLEFRNEAGPVLLSTPHLGENENKFVQQAFETNWIAPLGPNVENFESEMSNYLGGISCAALSSGTSAIHLGLILLGVQDGDRVYCSSFTFAASANPILYERAVPVFIDSERDSWNMSPRALERALENDRAANSLPKAIIIVDLYGQSADMDPLIEIAERYGVPVLEDAAESLGASYKGRKSGTFGRISVLSFNGNKIITTSGGGMLCCHDPDIAERARFLATQARESADHYEHRVVGYNYRMSNVLAGIGRGQLGVLNERVASRRSVFDRYERALKECGGIEFMPEPEGYFSTRWLSAVTFGSGAGRSNREILSGLRSVGIEARPLWKPMHMQPVFAGAEFVAHDEKNPICVDLYERGLCLPSGSNMSDEALDRVIEQLKYLLQA